MTQLSKIEINLRSCALAALYAVIPALIIGPAIFEIAVGLVWILFLVKTFKTRDIEPFKQSWFIAALFIWVYIVLSAYITIGDMPTSLKRAIPWGRFPLFALALQTWLLNSTACRRKFGWYLFIILTAVSVDALIQYLTGTSLTGIEKPAPTRLTGPFEDLVPGIFLVHNLFPVMGAMAASLLAIKSFGKRAAILIGCGGFFVLTILLTGERVAFLLAGLGSLFALIFAKGLRREIMLGGTIGVVVIAALLFWQPNLQERVIGTSYKEITHFSDSSYGRIFHNTIDVWQQRPIVGVGPRQYRNVCQDMDLPTVNNAKKHRCGLHVHNVYLEWLVETGMLGFFSFLFLIVLWSRHLVHALRPFAEHKIFNQQLYLELVGSWIGVLMFLWPLMSSMSLFTNWNATQFWLILGWALAVSTDITTRMEQASDQ